MLFVFRNYDKSKEAIVDTNTYRDAYIFATPTGITFELLERERLEDNIFRYCYNDYFISATIDTIIISGCSDRFDKFVDDVTKMCNNVTKSVQQL